MVVTLIYIKIGVIFSPSGRARGRQVPKTYLQAPQHQDQHSLDELGCNLLVNCGAKQVRNNSLFPEKSGILVICQKEEGSRLELVSEELNHLVAILHVYARGLIFMKKKKCIFQKENGNTLTLLIIILVKSIQKEQIAKIPSMTPDLPE